MDNHNEMMGAFGEAVRSINLSEIRSPALRAEIEEVENADHLRVVGGYLIRFGTEQTDLYGTWWDDKTYLGARGADGADVLVHHGIPLLDGEEFKQLAKTRLSPLRATVDELGVWAETVLDMNDAYQAKIYELTEAKRFSWSSATAEHMMDVDEKTGYVRSWPVVEGSLTPTPGNQHGGTKIEPLRSLVGLSVVPAGRKGAVKATPKRTTTQSPVKTITPNSSKGSPIRAMYLGEHIEVAITSVALGELKWKLDRAEDRVLRGYDSNYNVINLTLEEKMELILKMNEEYVRLKMRLIEAIMTLAEEEGEEAVNTAIRSINLALRAGKKLSKKSRAFVDSALAEGQTALSNAETVVASSRAVVDQLTALVRAVDDGELTEAEIEAVEDMAEGRSSALRSIFEDVLEERLAGIDFKEMATTVASLRAANVAPKAVTKEPAAPTRTADPEPPALSLDELRKRKQAA